MDRAASRSPRARASAAWTASRETRFPLPSAPRLTRSAWRASRASMSRFASAGPKSCRTSSGPCFSSPLRVIFACARVSTALKLLPMRMYSSRARGDRVDGSNALKASLGSLHRSCHRNRAPAAGIPRARLSSTIGGSIPFSPSLPLQIWVPNHGPSRRRCPHIGARIRRDARRGGKGAGTQTTDSSPCAPGPLPRLVHFCDGVMRPHPGTRVGVPGVSGSQSRPSLTPSDGVVDAKRWGSSTPSDGVVDAKRWGLRRTLKKSAISLPCTGFP